VTGAEKLPLDLMREFETKFGIQVSEGYGMTEASPVVACNLFDEPPSRMNPDGVLARRVGSVGRMLPGLTARIRDPETDRDLGLFQSGMLWLRGANVFEGYYKETDQTTAVLKDGWYRTGDLGRLDEDGFLFIEGRISRFSKIGGEMVPHGTVEQRIGEVLDLHPAAGEGPPVAVVGLPDDKKGETLVLLTTHPVDIGDLRKRLLAAGLASLWIPKVAYRVDAVPIMASGKLDLRECLRLAKLAVEPVEASISP
jgi:acyl-[acyl-carrier-protein]-phospholipid O-acyltransferase/long-chain-fatty-acid--[acyl-carrier-protein] ligase